MGPASRQHVVSRSGGSTNSPDWQEIQASRPESIVSHQMYHSEKTIAGFRVGSRETHEIKKKSITASDFSREGTRSIAVSSNLESNKATQ